MGLFEQLRALRTTGPLIQRHVSIFKSNSYFKGLHIPDKGPSTFDTLQGRYAGKGDGPDDEKERRLVSEAVDKVSGLGHW